MPSLEPNSSPIRAAVDLVTSTPSVDTVLEALTDPSNVRPIVPGVPEEVFRTCDVTAKRLATFCQLVASSTSAPIADIKFEVVPSDITGIFTAEPSTKTITIGLGVDNATALRRLAGLDIAAAHEIGHLVDMHLAASTSFRLGEGQFLSRIVNQLGIRDDSDSSYSIVEHALTEMLVDGIGAQINLRYGVPSIDVEGANARLVHIAKGLDALSQEAMPEQGPFEKEVLLALRGIARADALASLGTEVGLGAGGLDFIEKARARAENELAIACQRTGQSLTPELRDDILQTFARAYEVGFRLDLNASAEQARGTLAQAFTNRGIEILAEAGLTPEKRALEVGLIFASAQGMALDDEALVSIGVGILSAAASPNGRIDGDMLPALGRVIDVRLSTGQTIGMLIKGQQSPE
ncbi:MAG: hypothetical protein K1X79_08075 [Oligoflexia bacterium]|nr:hypothetical protein [Oligoflexia bacterium]